jgi:hypothetical protein
MKWLTEKRRRRRQEGGVRVQISVPEYPLESWNELMYPDPEGWGCASEPMD